MAQKKFRQGYYKPKNPEKYKGNTASVIYRSSWERKVMEFFDTSRNIEWWNSEGLVIPYMSIDKKVHRYFPDFIFLNKKNETYIVEIKPFRETLPPTRRQRNYNSASITYVINQLKWKASEEFCKKQNILFRVWTEKELKRMGIM